jgi:hypothetical protein
MNINGGYCEISRKLATFAKKLARSVFFTEDERVLVLNFLMCSDVVQNSPPIRPDYQKGTITISTLVERVCVL